ncbi:Lactate utilization protein B [Thalassoglobus neptunius]|uniref:Lactate utilization protein B n=1 Tax=Thalassoglobus neptunius TaxID=1938619 RepID=A0A5C5X6R3_9PLAN|nr:LutB/LldF family L-lactate oxidation iron-sulfur protein [Thalassoglobus neptunius]TWT57953.1 Lactate utilization protein B [Thalassoglobus neptunius]
MATATSHPAKATEFIKNAERAAWHDRTLWFVRAKRDKAAESVPEWEELRERASQIKKYTMTNMAELLEQFEQQAQANGIQVHWAKDAAEHNEIVLKLLQSHDVKKVVKSKSMLTEECHLNPFLERNDIEVVDTDLGEWIVQLREEPPSHIVMPAIHTKREEIGELFHQKIGTEKGATDPQYLTEAARQELRQRFLAADAGITGVNFAVAETGGIVVCTNEGNADLGTSLPKLHIACMGIEKVIPRQKDLAVFLRLLARSATGQPITTYSTHFHGPREPGCEMHIVLVDNGRSEILGSDDFRRSLNCIRCGACMNTCPVYRRSGGHSYSNTVPGPIGSILAPSQDAQTHSSLPYACSLCGSCSDVCPVKINLHEQLYTWRSKLVLKGLLPISKKLPMQVAAGVLSRPWLYRFAGSVGRFALRYLPRFMIYNRFNDWGNQRELPVPPKQSFRQLYEQRKKKQ